MEKHIFFFSLDLQQKKKDLNGIGSRPVKDPGRTLNFLGPIFANIFNKDPEYLGIGIKKKKCCYFVNPYFYIFESAAPNVFLLLKSSHSFFVSSPFFVNVMLYDAPFTALIGSRWNFGDRKKKKNRFEK